ncbi:sensor of ECF-type sigma factor [Gaetbulibacter aquiaggeris]|uniref:Sensor of ECF-type sigma factor n=1 Tax=Gaetbulibacter aquiaggeris TaxID=1735373 RepID=A0ABW7MXE5_9FLAO
MKTITSIVFIISFSILSFAQSNRDKIKTLKIAYITEKLDLSEKEAQIFWPVYNAFEEENFKLRKQSFEGKKNINFETLKEEEAISILKEMRAFDSKRITLKNNFIDDLTKIISAKKIILLEKAEDDFKHKMFEEFKSRRPDRGRKD